MAAMVTVHCLAVQENKIMKVKYQNGEVAEVEKGEAVLLIASGKAERVLPEEKPKKESKKAKESEG